MSYSHCSYAVKDQRLLVSILVYGMQPLTFRISMCLWIMIAQPHGLYVPISLFSIVSVISIDLLMIINWKHYAFGKLFFLSTGLACPTLTWGVCKHAIACSYLLGWQKNEVDKAWSLLLIYFDSTWSILHDDVMSVTFEFDAGSLSQENRDTISVLIWVSWLSFDTGAVI